jgi:hypothetical protein
VNFLEQLIWSKEMPGVLVLDGTNLMKLSKKVNSMLFNDNSDDICTTCSASMCFVLLYHHAMFLALNL